MAFPGESYEKIYSNNIEDVAEYELSHVAYLWLYMIRIQIIIKLMVLL